MIKKAIMLVSVMVLSMGIAFAASNSQATTNDDAAYAMITGSVVDTNSGNAVSNATVTITGTEKSTTTDEYGTFVFEQIETGSHTLSIEADGYQSTEKSLEVTEEGANVEVKVEPEM